MEAVVKEVEKLTQEGTQYLKNGDLQAAQQSFQQAFNQSQGLSDDYVVRACAFNLGAVYVALHNPQPALELLNHAVPQSEVHDGRSLGDLYFNFSVAYELLQNDVEAARYYELSLEEYQKEKDSWEMEAEVGMKLGSTYTRIVNMLQAARGYGVAATAYARCNMFSEQAVSLCKQASLLLHANRPVDALRAADDSSLLCQKVIQTDDLCLLYHDLGLVYTQCREFPRAATCFELALPLCKGLSAESRHRAVILQNLGAVYNSMREYHHAVGFHEAAAALHGELGNRGEQGQCFINLGFARSQLNDLNSAGECYLHALQASRDTNDFRGQWQSLEGLGAVAFNQGKVDVAVERFKEALTKLSSSSNQNRQAQERIVAKLADALRYQLVTASSDSKPLRKTASVKNGRVSRAKAVDILVNNEPRPPTRDEQRYMDELRSRSLSLRGSRDTVDRAGHGSRHRTSSAGEAERRFYHRRSSSRKFKGLGLTMDDDSPEMEDASSVSTETSEDGKGEENWEGRRKSAREWRKTNLLKAIQLRRSKKKKVPTATLR